MAKFDGIKTEYDLESLGRVSRRALAFHILILTISSLVLVLCAVVIILHGSRLVVFLTALAATIVAVLGIWCECRSTRVGRVGDFSGTVRGAYVEMKSIRSTAGWDIGLFKRRYDHYRREELRAEVVVENDECAVMYKLHGVSPKHAEYYTEGSEVVHVSGARFPVKCEIDGDEYLCPICGEFNSREDKVCRGCGVKALK